MVNNNNTKNNNKFNNNNDCRSSSSRPPSCEKRCDSFAVPFRRLEVCGGMWRAPLSSGLLASVMTLFSPSVSCRLATSVGDCFDAKAFELAASEAARWRSQKVCRWLFKTAKPHSSTYRCQEVS
ncbi:unnamed protein product [Polarella glacialis]|uniref:Uncharacterized protein n=1 Tax=Polarella glacialis TaxID=89957 RepID=A0A813ECT3_POLGL|nr:unnamed protein product [Polarella glacialis]